MPSSRIAAALLANRPCRSGRRPTAALVQLLRTTALRVCATTVERVAVILGEHADAISPALVGLPVAPVYDPFWREGTSSAVRTAVQWANEADGLLFLGRTHARLSARHLESLLRAFRSDARTVASGVAGTLELPAVVDRADFPRLRALDSDEGPASLLRDSAWLSVVDWPEGAAEHVRPAVR